MDIERCLRSQMKDKFIVFQIIYNLVFQQVEPDATMTLRRAQGHGTLHKVSWKFDCHFHKNDHREAYKVSNER